MMSLSTPTSEESDNECSEESVRSLMAGLQETEIEYWQSFFIHLEKSLDIKLDSKPLFHAIHELDISSVQRLLSISPKDVEARGTYGASPLAELSALRIDQRDQHKQSIALEIANLLIKMGANVECGFIDESFLAFTHVTPVIAAVVNGNVSLVELLLKNGANPSVKAHPMKVTPIFFAAIKKRADIFDALLRSGANINDRDVDENSVLIIACAAASNDIVEIILSQKHTDKIDIHAKNKRQCTALHAAVFGGSCAIIELLLKLGADVNAETVEGYTPLDVAVVVGNKNIEELLKKKKGTSKLCDKILKERLWAFFTTTYGNFTQLHRFARLNRVKPMIFFLDRGTDVNVKDIFRRTPLFIAVEAEAMDAAILLLSRGAEVDEAALDGFTPLFHAVDKGCEEMVKLLLSYGAKANFLNVFRLINVSLLHVACGAPGNEETKNMCCLARNTRKQPENMKIARIVKLLIKKYAPFDMADIQGERPLDRAIRSERSEVVKILKLQDQLYTCIHQGNLKELDTCVKNGAIVNCCSFRYQSPLHYAVINGKVEIVTRLIELGADVNYAPNDGFTALGYAAKYNQPQIGLKLLFNGATIKAQLNVCEQKAKHEVSILRRFVQSVLTSTETGSTDSKEFQALIGRKRNSEGHIVSALPRND